jgi:hypothetical protein
VHHVGAGGRERPVISAHVADPSEAVSAAALAVLGDHLRGDFPRAWRLVDAFERKFLAPLNVLDEFELEVGAIAAWIAARRA